MDRLFYIYKLTFPNGNIYIGQTNDIGRRFTTYRGLDCKNQPLLFNHLNKYEWDSIKIELLYNNVTNQNHIDELETYYINSIDDIYSLNIVKESRNLPKVNRKDRYNATPVTQFDTQGNFIKNWNTMSDVQDTLNISVSTISIAIRSKRHYSGGFLWTYTKDYTGGKFIKPSKTYRKVVQLNKRGVYIKTHKSAEEAAKSVNGLKSSITSVCCKSKKSVYGFIWVYEDHYLDEFFKIREAKKFTIPVDIFDLQGSLIKQVNSVKEASEFCKVNRVTVIRGCKGKVKNATKFIFKYGNKRN